MTKKKKFEIVMEFEDEDLAQNFFSYMSDGGGEQGAAYEDDEGILRYMEFDYWGGKKGSNFLGNKRVIVTRGDCKYDE